MTLSSRIASWIAPRYCLLCGSDVPDRDSLDIPLCPNCENSLARIDGERCEICGRPLFSEKNTCFSCRSREHDCPKTYPVFKYSGNAAVLIRRYKSEKRSSLAPYFSGIFSELIDELWTESVIVPVPPRPEKLARREWDQVEAITRCLEKSGRDVRRLLVRKSEIQQKKLSRELRLENARKAYQAAIPEGQACPPQILLIDDVYTTGATVDACARALFQAGARDVSALVLAAD